jgi:hypothetical protein
MPKLPGRLRLVLRRHFPIQDHLQNGFPLSPVLDLGFPILQEGFDIQLRLLFLPSVTANAMLLQEGEKLGFVTQTQICELLGLEERHQEKANEKNRAQNHVGRRNPPLPIW